MILAFIMLFVGAILLGGAWSFAKQRHPWWSVAVLALAGLLCIGVSLFRIYQ
ncbi:hypothetical protein M3A96_06760 [Helcobacillus massiliensis]|uniref:Membrane protein YdbS with pleckstrin-like domain n=1 Tax=Helcobacillus massiliensis TaxID=521392 RepID=A0A839QWV7_9MICO|nr:MULTISPECIES: hypothetical protein [Helcobacillus]MBB3021857.1 membrane protein YdbS with pleckstrin-like domain [Helcobacillus massiliensis]MCG7427109.1 hypothetical protein [Helcobacillus sp. ACRRO]MCT1557814.1 hypothetical protein [Helcobacillus massiliensis]MCT2036690.1 hypothetical protein [Helcobacillus massiliensis]MCT2332161.1 hypothetical protein [Helcobacillus massiliensis]